jgi:hypothetical protein
MRSTIITGLQYYKSVERQYWFFLVFHYLFFPRCNARVLLLVEYKNRCMVRFFSFNQFELHFFHPELHFSFSTTFKLHFLSRYIWQLATDEQNSLASSTLSFDKLGILVSP